MNTEMINNAMTIKLDYELPEYPKMEEGYRRAPRREAHLSESDKALVIKLDASKSGALDFVLRPTVPYEQEYMTNPGDNGGKTGTVT